MTRWFWNGPRLVMNPVSRRREQWGILHASDMIVGYMSQMTPYNNALMLSDIKLLSKCGLWFNLQCSGNLTRRGWVLTTALNCRYD